MSVVVSSSQFDRQIKKLQQQHADIVASYEESIAVLKTDPHNTSRTHPIKKLSDIPFGDGQWRIKIGRYRIRYDTDGQTVILCHIRDRKDVYRK